MRSFEVVVGGQRIRFRSASSETEIEELVRAVNGRIESLQRSTRVVTTQSLALMAALDFADELRRERGRRRNTRDELQALLALADAALGPRGSAVKI